MLMKAYSTTDETGARGRTQIRVAPRTAALTRFVFWALMRLTTTWNPAGRYSVGTRPAMISHTGRRHRLVTQREGRRLETTRGAVSTMALDGPMTSQRTMSPSNRWVMT